jgi:hypothetical protein
MGDDMKRAAKKRVGRPPGRTAPHRPVVSGRVPEEFHKTITEAAQKSGRTISEELIWRAQQSFEWEKTFGNARKVLDDAKRVTAQNLPAQLRAAGYRYVSGIGGGAWFDPGVDAVAWIFDNSNRDVLEEMLERAATRALEKRQIGEDK